MGLFVLSSEVTLRWQQVICISKESTQDMLMVMRFGIGDLLSRGLIFWLFPSDDGR